MLLPMAAAFEVICNQTETRDANKPANHHGQLQRLVSPGTFSRFLHGGCTDMLML